MLGMYQLCAWELNWLDGFTQGDQPVMEESLSHLRSIAMETPTFGYIRDDLNTNFDRAELGDPSGIQQHVHANGCADRPFLPPEAPDAAIPKRTISMALSSEQTRHFTR